jgi:DNA-binding MarR family transcriptional regulator
MLDQSKYDEFEDALKEWMKHLLRLSMKGFIEYAAETKLSMPQIALLIRLNGKRRCGVTELGEEFGVSGAAASQMVDRLVQLGLLERVEDVDDRRVRRLLLTQKGRAIVERNFEARQGWIKSFCSTIRPELAHDAAHILRELVAAAQVFEGAEHVETLHRPWRDRGMAPRIHPRRR